MTNCMIKDAAAKVAQPLEKLLESANKLAKEQTQKEQSRLIQDMIEKAKELTPIISSLKGAATAAAKTSEVVLEQVDMTALIRQVQLEETKQAEKAGLSFRFRFPEEKVMVSLDSEKAYRIFDILFKNIIKYSQPGSRAYVAVTDYEDRVEILLKNISEKELDTDLIRSAQESPGGLNTALAKSLTELMNGSFQVSTDGDLFKTELVFMK